MSASNQTGTVHLSQFEDSDKPSWLGDYNTDMAKIDAQIAALIGIINNLQVQVNTLSTRITTLATDTGHSGV